MSWVTVAVGDRERGLSASVAGLGDDLVVAIGGGGAPHVGSVVLATPRPSTRDPERWSASCSVLTIPPHKDEAVARRVAERLAAGLRRTVVVAAGVHEDALDEAGVATYLRLADQLGEALASRLGAG